jgi:hypothetical protein
MLTYRTWTNRLLGVVLAFAALNGIIWLLFTRPLFEFHDYYNGGLDRMGYIVGSKDFRTPEHTLPKRAMENADYRGTHIDMVTVGDSFLNVRDNGRDPLVQDWIASVRGLDILNVQNLPGANPYETVVILANSGWLDRVRPRFVLLETVERDCILEYSGPQDLAMTRPPADVDAYLRTARYDFHWPRVGFINTGNFKFLYYNIRRRYSDHAFTSNVYTRELREPLFSVRNDRLLLFYADDLTSIPVATKRTVGTMNDNLDRLADLLARKGIGLYFMPAADKYDIYSGYIVNNPYPASVFFELLRPLPKRYTLIDTKALLSEEVAKGEKDVYYADDTHWSWKGAKKIAEQTFFPDRQGRPLPGRRASR